MGPKTFYSASNLAAPSALQRVLSCRTDFEMSLYSGGAKVSSQLCRDIW